MFPISEIVCALQYYYCMVLHMRKRPNLEI